MTARSIRRLTRRAYYGLKGFKLYPLLDQLERSQHWSREQMGEYRDEKIRVLIRHAYDTVPYYRRRMDELHLRPEDIRGSADLAKLPVLTRRDVRDHCDELISKQPSVGKPIWHSTGGTTGEPLRTANDLYGTAWGNAAYYRGLSWAGYDFDRDRVAILFGGSLKPGRDRRHFGLGSLRLLLPAWEVQPRKAKEYHEALRTFQPEYLKGYSNATYLLARSFKESGLPTIPLKAVFATSEHLPEYQQRLIEEVFDTRVFGYYGSVEINSIGYQCHLRDGFHIPEEHVFVETIQDGTETTAEALGHGHGGAFAITDLDNFHMPLIRYRNGDAGVLNDETCGCGRQLTRIKPLFGRVVDLLRNTDGHLVPGGIVDFIVGDTRHIREVCLVQEEQALCRLQYVCENGGGEVPEVITKLRAYLGSDMKIVPEPVDVIPLTASGKRRFTISKLNDQ